MVSLDKYINLILKEREWSWAVVALGYIVVTLFIRQIMFHGVVRQARGLGHEIYRSAKNLYLKNSWSGWIIFLISLLMVVTIWICWKRETPIETSTLLVMLFLLPLIFLISVIMHLISFSKALAEAVRQKLGIEKEL